MHPPQKIYWHEIGICLIPLDAWINLTRPSWSEPPIRSTNQPSGPIYSVRSPIHWVDQLVSPTYQLGVNYSILVDQSERWANQRSGPIYLVRSPSNWVHQLVSLTQLNLNHSNQCSGPINEVTNLFGPFPIKLRWPITFADLSICLLYTSPSPRD